MAAGAGGDEGALAADAAAPKVRARFPRHSHLFFPVVHVSGAEQAVENVHIAVRGGADGCILIQHDGLEAMLLDAYAAVRRAYPKLFLGLNFLSYSPMEMMRHVPADCDAIWIDDADVTEHGVGEKWRQAQAIREERKWEGVVLGGVAFKYVHSTPFEALPAAAAAARSVFDIPCTSGPGTGFAIDVKKLDELRKGLGTSALLAVASGVSAANVAEQMAGGRAQVFLVASSLLSPERSADGGELFDAAKVSELASLIHAHSAPEAQTA
jgi:hypothetical protein